MIDEVDIDKTGTITFDEFVVMIVLRMEDAMMSDQAQVRQAFDVFDMDKTGLITTTELQRALNKRCDQPPTDQHFLIAAEFAVGLTAATSPQRRLMT